MGNYNKGILEIREAFAPEIVGVLPENDPIKKLESIQECDNTPTSQIYETRFNQYESCLEQLFDRNTVCEINYIVLCLLNAIRKANFGIESDAIRREIAHRTVNVAMFAFTTYDEAYETMRKMLSRGVAVKKVTQAIDVTMKKVLSEPDETRPATMASHIELAIIMNMIYLDHDWTGAYQTEDVAQIAQYWYDTFYHSPDDPLREQLKELELASVYNEETISPGNDDNSIEELNADDTNPNQKPDFKRILVDQETEQEWFNEEETKSLIGAAVLIPENTELSDDAIETIRHFRYYRNAQDAFVLFSDRVAAFVDAGNIEEMVTRAEREAYTVTGSMPDFAPYNTDDGCGLLHMINAHVFAFRPFGIDNGFLLSALEARQECLDACEQCEIVAVVYCNADDYE